ncbi:MAG: hypothetical protein Q4B43_03000 [Bacteroidota bacterium]|nr:hypothetical protein [Bacteroidota bacterium]
MENLEKSIPLRPRFSIESNRSKEQLFELFILEKSKSNELYTIVHSDNYIWIYPNKKIKKYYSPHLQLELVESKDNHTAIKGLFGPDPTLWTFFMFLHFLVACVFLMSLITSYSNHAMGQSLTSDFILMGGSVVVWFLLYFIARIVRNKGAKQMHQLKEYLYYIINQ